MEHSKSSSIKYFFRETFRPRGLEEYKALLKSGESLNRRPVPWLYLRVLAAGFVLFAICVLLNKLTSYTSAFPMAVVFGGIMVNIPLVIFFYELCPRRETGLLTLFAVVIVGGVISTALALFGYRYIYDGHENPWISYLWTGFLEELAKMACALPAIALLKKKDPFACFLIGIAVGTGYSVFEDFGYIYSYGQGFRTGDMWLVLMSVGRGLSCFCSHAPWTGVICWAFAAFKKPWLNFRFYLVIVASILLHYLADVPFYADGVQFLAGFNAGWVIEAAVVAGIVAMVVVMLRRSYRELGCEKRTEEEMTATPLTKSQKLSHAGNLTAVLCAVFISVLTCAGCALQFGRTEVVQVIESDGEFIGFVQNGLPLSADWERAYDGSVADYSQFIEDGEVKNATQKVAANGYDYFYVYDFGEEGARLSSVGVKVEGKVYYCRRMFVYDDGSSMTNYGYPSGYSPVEDDPVPPEEPSEPEEPVEPVEPVEPPKLIKTLSYFKLAETAVSYDAESGRYNVSQQVSDLAAVIAAVGFAALSGVTAVGGATAYITLKIKCKRWKDD